MLERIGVDRTMKEEEQFLSEDSSDTLSSKTGQNDDSFKKAKIFIDELDTSQDPQDLSNVMNLDKFSSSKSH